MPADGAKPAPQGPPEQLAIWPTQADGHRSWGCVLPLMRLLNNAPCIPRQRAGASGQQLGYKFAPIREQPMGSEERLSSERSDPDNRLSIGIAILEAKPGLRRGGIRDKFAGMPSAPPWDRGRARRRETCGVEQYLVGWSVRNFTTPRFNGFQLLAMLGSFTLLLI